MSKMNKFVCLFVLFIGFCKCADEILPKEIPKKFLIEIVENDDEDKGIWRPCPDNDIKCVRHYFASNSRCFPAYGKVPDPYYMKQMVLPLPNANLTLVVINGQTLGLNGKIVEFYVNKVTDKVVLAVEFNDLTIFSDEVEYRYHRKGNEPVVKSDYSGISYKSVTLTAILPFANNLQLDKAEFNAYIDDPRPVFIIGPKHSNGNDPVQKSYTHFLTNMNENVREAFIVQAPLYMSLFIQTSVCNFHLKVDL